MSTYCLPYVQRQIIGNSSHCYKGPSSRYKSCTTFYWWWRWQRILRGTTISCLHIILLILFPTTLGEDLNKMCFSSSTSMSRCPRLLTGKSQLLLLQLPPGIIINLCSSWIPLWRQNPHILPLRLESLSLGVRCSSLG